MTSVWKALYVICRQTGLSGLPIFRTGRNLIYRRYLNAPGINVDDFVRIGTAHRNISGSSINIGKDLHVSRDVDVDFSGSIEIGDRVTISEGAKVFTHSHVIDGEKVDWRPNPIEFSDLVIGDDAWIGAGALILPSVKRIGRGAVVAAGAVVTKDVESFAVVGGNPARMLRSRRIEALNGDAQDVFAR